VVWLLCSFVSCKVCICLWEYVVGGFMQSLFAVLSLVRLSVGFCEVCFSSLQSL
jgi:hypothetical protein